MANHDIGKGVWHDPDKTGYIGLDVTADIPPQEMRTVEGAVLLPKDEYHCSLVACRDHTDDREEERSIANAVKDYLRTHDLRFVGLGDERYLCRKDDRLTIVAPVRVDGIDEFCAFVQTLIPEYRPPFLHVTLLKSEATEFGIAVNSLDELGRYCEKLAH